MSVYNILLTFIFSRKKTKLFFHGPLKARGLARVLKPVHLGLTLGWAELCLKLS